MSTAKKSKSKADTETKYTLTEAEVPKTSRALKRNPVYDKIINDVVNASGTSYKVTIEGKDYRKLWSPLSTRIKEYNAKADRKFNLKLRTADKQTYIVKEPIKK